MAKSRIKQADHVPAVLERFYGVMKEKGVDEKQIRNDLLEKVGLSRTTLDKALKNYEEGSNTRFRKRTIAGLARLAGTSARWMEHGEGQTTIDGDGMESEEGGQPVIAEAGAGTWREMDVLEGKMSIDPVPLDPRHDRHIQSAFQVGGNSINKVAQHGDILLCLALPGRQKPRDLVVVLRQREGRQELTVKRYIETNGSIILQAESDDPRYSDPTHPQYAPPIEYKRGADAEDDGTLVSIIAIVIGIYKRI